MRNDEYRLLPAAFVIWHYIAANPVQYWLSNGWAL
jgi:hypothetical protein